MIPFNVPPFIGEELDYKGAALNALQIAEYLIAGGK